MQRIDGTLSREAMLQFHEKLMTVAAIGKVLGVLLIGGGAPILAGIDRGLEALPVQWSLDWLTDLTTRYWSALKPSTWETDMKCIQSLAVAFLLVPSLLASAADGLIAVKSSYGPKETMDRLEIVLKEKGMTIFARVDHASGAAKVGKQLRPTEVLIFGNPQGGTPFMECGQTVGIDLPLKALVWEDGSGQVWLGYNDPTYVANRHDVPQCPVVGNLKQALAGFAQATVAR